MKKVIDYVRRMKRRGVSDKLIVNKLISSGYPKNITKEIMKRYKIETFFRCLFLILFICIITFAVFNLVKEVRKDKCLFFWNNRDIECVLKTFDNPEFFYIGDENASIEKCKTYYEEYRYYCYWELGNFFSTNSEGNYICEMVTEFKPDCYSGYAHGIGVLTKDLSKIEEFCEKIPKEYYSECYDGFIVYLYYFGSIDDCSYLPTSKITKCKEILEK